MISSSFLSLYNSTLSILETPTPITDNIPSSSSHSSSNAAAIVFSVLVPGIVIVVIIIAIITYNKKRRGRTTTTASSYQTQTTGTVSTNHQAVAQQTAQTTSFMPYANTASSAASQYVYPTASIQNGDYFTGSHATSYSTPYSTAPYNTVGNTSQQISFTVAPSNTSVPPGALQQQQTGGTTFHTSEPTFNQTSPYLFTGPPVEAPPNVPPPSYNTIVSS